MIKIESKNLLKHEKQIAWNVRSLGFRFLRQMRGFSSLFLALGRITYSYLPNRFLV